MNEIKTLVSLLTDLGLPFTFSPVTDGFQVTILNSEGYKLDDAIWRKGSHGYKEGLLETYHLSDCDGYETALEVAHGWYDMYYEQGRFA